MTRSPLSWPDPRLQKAAEPVAVIDEDVRGIWDEMIAIMDAMPGVGLAAPQIGVMKRLAVVDASDARGRAVRMANPEIIDTSADTNTHVEASPNLPGVSAAVTRPARVVVRYLADNGIMERREFSGLWATSVQHQIDHLNGRMYFHNLSPMKRQMLLKKAAKKGARP